LSELSSYTTLYLVPTDLGFPLLLHLASVSLFTFLLYETTFANRRAAVIVEIRRPNDHPMLQIQRRNALLDLVSHTREIKLNTREMPNIITVGRLSFRDPHKNLPSVESSSPPIARVVASKEATPNDPLNCRTVQIRSLLLGVMKSKRKNNRRSTKRPK